MRPICGVVAEFIKLSKNNVLKKGDQSRIFFNLISRGAGIRSPGIVVQLLVLELHKIRIGLVEFLSMRPESGNRRLPQLQSVSGRRGLHVGRICGRDERSAVVMAEGQRYGRSALVARAQRDRCHVQARGTRLQNAPKRNTSSAGQRAQLLSVLDNINNVTTYL